MESNDRDDGAAGDPDAHHNRDFEPLPPAPLPAHERAWRHPSELGANTVEVLPRPQPAISRRATVATVAAGVLLVVGAVRLMAPSSSSSSTADGVTVLTVGATALSTTVSEQATAQPTDAPRASITASATFLATTTLVVHVTAATPVPVELDDLTVGDDPTIYAVVLADGRFLATTASAVDGLDAVDVHLPTGDTVTATIVRADGPIVLLDLSGASTPPAPHGDTPDAGEVVMVGTPAGEARAMVGDPNDDGFPQLVSDLPLHDSGPVYDGDGTLVGICTHGTDELNWLVPVAMLDQMAADHDVDEPVTEASTDAPTTSSPTTEVTTSTSSTTVTTTTLVMTTTPTTSTPKSSPTTSTPKPPPTTTVAVSATPTTTAD